MIFRKLIILPIISNTLQLKYIQLKYILRCSVIMERSLLQKYFFHAVLHRTGVYTFVPDGTNVGKGMVTIMNFRQRIAQFFYGRYGIDGLYYGLLVTIFVLWILRVIFMDSVVASVLIYILETFLLIWMLYRCMSRNIAARQRENQIFSSSFKKIKNFFILQKNKIRDFKSYRYKKCPHCKATLRLPKRKGTHSVICPRCARRFDVTTRI